MFHFASKGGYYLSAAFIQERPLIEHIRYIYSPSVVIVLPEGLKHPNMFWKPTTSYADGRWEGLVNFLLNWHSDL